MTKKNNSTFRDMTEALEKICTDSLGRLYSKVEFDLRYNGNSLTVTLFDCESAAHYIQFDGEEYNVIHAVMRYIQEDV